MRSLLIFASSFAITGIGAACVHAEALVPALAIFALAGIVFFIGLIVNHGEHTRR